MVDGSDSVIDSYDDERISLEYRDTQCWKRGFETAKRWYHEEWDGSEIQLRLARDIAEAISDAVSTALLDYM